MITVPAIDTAGVVAVAPGVQWEWLCGGRAFAVHLTSPSRISIDAFYEITEQVIRGWDQNTPLYCIQNISHPDITLTPYFRRCLDAINALTNELQVTTFPVIILQNNISGHAMRLFGTGAARHSNWIHPYYVNDYAQAVKGLDQLMCAVS